MVVYCYSANESKELVINVTQTVPKEELPASPSQESQSPLTTPTRSLSQSKYQTSLTRLNSGGRVIEPEHFSDSNGHFASHRDYEHTPLFLPEDSTPYYNHHELYYPPYNEIEGPYATLTGSVGSQSRPFSASSSSCSSVESGATSDNNAHHYQSPGGLNPLVGVTGGSVNATSEFVIASNCFDPHSPPHANPTTWSGAIAHQTDFKHEFAHHPAHNPGYTSVIVESQQYQLANEYVHWICFPL